MNRIPTPDDRLRAAFAARLANAPEPSAGMRARTEAAIDREVLRSRRLAAPARLATAAVIVIVAGTIAFGDLKHTGGPAIPAGNARVERITLEDHIPPPVQTAFSGHMAVTVRDMPHTMSELARFVAREHAQLSPSSVPAASTTPARLTLVIRIDPTRLDAAMNAVAAVGAVTARTVATTDLHAAFGDIAHRLAVLNERSQSVNAAVRTKRDDALEYRRLLAHRRELEGRLTTATLAVDVFADPHARWPHSISAVRELRSLAARRTSITLARGPSVAAQNSLDIGHRVRALAVAARRARSAGPPAS